MKKNTILFRMAARCEAAGRPNNEDNYQLDDNLSDNSWGFTADAEVSLGEKGALLVVCDGMGGMNAGEVASDIAVKTIKEWFTTDKLTDAAIAAPCKYISSAIVAADAAIKAHSKTNPDTEGMGSTIVLAWLLGQKVYVGWCGDSRCYRFNPALGLERLSHDHSYVQELVDAGKLTEELAFDHPNNNIITRSLGDPRGAAQPDCKEFDLYNQDIILLCSDGLCGTLRDNEIAELIKQHQTSMQECRDALWNADEAAGWTDNTTIALAQIISGGKDATATTKASTASTDVSTSKAKLISANKRLKLLIAVIISFILLCMLLYGGYRCRSKMRNFFKVQDTETIADSTYLNNDVVLPNDSIKNDTKDNDTDKEQVIETTNNEKKTKTRTSAPSGVSKTTTQQVVIQKQEQTDTIVPQVKKVSPIENLSEVVGELETSNKDSVPATEKINEEPTVEKIASESIEVPVVNKDSIVQGPDTIAKNQ